MFQGYDERYLAEYAARSSSEIGQRIYAARWAFVQRHCSGGRLLDYGCATGAFHLSRPKDQWQVFDATGYDINPNSIYSLAPKGVFDILTMWDVIEHLVIPTDPIRGYRPAIVFISTPNIDDVDDFNAVRSWKHWKPGEHLHYFNLKSLAAVLACEGYSIVEHNFEEGLIRAPARPNAILSVVARRD